MKQSLLEIVQDMLSAIDSENVNSVGETEEAGQCVLIANRAYQNMMAGRRWKHLKTFSRLEASTNLNELKGPAGTVAIDPYNLYYDTQQVWYMDAADFLQFTISRPTDSTITEINDLKVYNDRDPQFFTSDNDEILKFDAIPNAISGLDASKSRAIIYLAPTSKLTDDDEYFQLPAVCFPALTQACIGMAVMELKGDGEGGRMAMNEYSKLLARLMKNARLVDTLDDVRQTIVPRRTRRMNFTPRIA